MPTTLTVTTTIKIPRVPNFLITESGLTLPLYAASERDLRAIGAAWTEALVVHSKEQLKAEKCKDAGG